MRAAQDAVGAIDAVVFDLGGVLIDWNPRHLYRKLIADADEIERFLREVCPQSWNELQDAGRSVEVATAERCALFPQHAGLIAAYYGRWDEMLGGAIAGTVAVLERLDAAGMPLYALSNWSAELFPIARARYDFLARFRGIVLSGEEGLVKPDPRIFRRLFGRYALAPERSLFIDDVPANVAAAQRLGMAAIRYESPQSLAAQLGARGLLRG